MPVTFFTQNHERKVFSESSLELSVKRTEHPNIAPILLICSQKVYNIRKFAANVYVFSTNLTKKKWLGLSTNRSRDPWFSLNWLFFHNFPSRRSKRILKIPSESPWYVLSSYQKKFQVEVELACWSWSWRWNILERSRRIPSWSWRFTLLDGFQSKKKFWNFFLRSLQVYWTHPKRKIRLSYRPEF